MDPKLSHPPHGRTASRLPTAGRLAHTRCSHAGDRGLALRQRVDRVPAPAPALQATRQWPRAADSRASQMEGRPRVQSSPRRSRLPRAAAVYHHRGSPRNSAAVSAELIRSDPSGTGKRIGGRLHILTRSHVEDSDGPARLEQRPQLVRPHSRAPKDAQKAVPPGTAQRHVQEERDEDNEQDSEAEMQRGLRYCLAYQVSEAHPRPGPERRGDRAVDKKARDTFAGRPGKAGRDRTQLGQEPGTQPKCSFVITEESLTPLDAPPGRRREARDQSKCPGSPPCWVIADVANSHWPA